MLQSKNANRFPLNQVFSDYNLKYIHKKDKSEMTGEAKKSAKPGHKHN